jgi:hypothetical protein
MSSIMRTSILTVALSLALVANSRAQSTSSGAVAPPQSEPADGMLDKGGLLQSATAKDGFYPEFGGIVTGDGWISAGPGYRRHLFDGHVFVDASAEISVRAYKLAQARVELPSVASKRVMLGAQARWQDFTQVNYFGIGPDTAEASRSDYRVKDTDVLLYGAIRPNNCLSVTGRFGWLKAPTLSSSTGPFDGDYPNALEEFAGDPGVADPISFIHGDMSIAADTRDHRDHPTAGSLYRASAAMYSDRDLGRFTFRRYDAEAMQVIPIVDEKWLVTLHGWGVVSDTSNGNEVPFYLLPDLGGNSSLRGFNAFRFHDRNLLLASAELRHAISSLVEGAVFFDAGNVAHRAADLDLGKTSYGAGLRLHTGSATLARLDVAHSHEGWQVWMSLSDPFRLARRSERSTIVPFVP